MKYRYSLLVCILLLFISPFASAFGEVKFIVDIQIETVRKNLDVVTRKITKLESQLASLNQTYFKDEQEKEDYENGNTQS